VILRVDVTQGHCQKLALDFFPAYVIYGQR
jgi:hypothetical protein